MRLSSPRARASSSRRRGITSSSLPFLRRFRFSPLSRQSPQSLFNGKSSFSPWAPTGDSSHSRTLLILRYFRHTQTYPANSIINSWICNYCGKIRATRAFLRIMAFRSPQNFIIFMRSQYCCNTEINTVGIVSDFFTIESCYATFALFYAYGKVILLRSLSVLVSFI